MFKEVKSLKKGLMVNRIKELLLDPKSGYYSANSATVPVKGISLMDALYLETINQLKLMQM